MSKKSRSFGFQVIPRSVTASLAGIRAGGALAVDSAVGKVTRRSAHSEESRFAQREAQRFAQELGRLKGTYIKIGQMLALFGDQFLPPVLVSALRDLSDQTEPLHWDALESFCRDSLGERYGELEIDPEAVAAASLAQVHLAKVRKTGEWICLKIQYPGLAQLIDDDFDAVVRMLVLARWVKSGSDLDDWLEAMRASLHDEVNYRREATLGQKMGALVDALPPGEVAYHVPTLIQPYCTETVLAMEFIEGHSVIDEDVTNLPQPRRNALAKAMLNLFFYELYDWGILQTDPNFGNYLLRLDDRRKRTGDDELVLLDFGSVLECSPSFLHHLRAAIDAGQRQDVDTLVKSLIGLDCLQKDSDDEAKTLFAEFCMHLLEPLRAPEDLPKEYLNANGEYCWGRSQLMRRAGKMAASSMLSRHFSTPSRDFAFIARKLSGVFNFITVLDAQFNAHDLLLEHTQRWREKDGKA